MNPNQIEVIQTEATEVKQIEAVTRIEPKTSAALPNICCALSRWLSGIERLSLEL